MVFLAELGDRSQVVLPRVAVAAFLVHGVAVTIGRFLGATLPARPLAFASADETIQTTHEPRFASALGRRSVAIAVIASVALAVATMAAAQTLRRHRAEATIAGRSPDIV